LVAVSKRVAGWVRELVVCGLFINIWLTFLASTEVAECTVNLKELGEQVVVLE
jgi:hypothetical protein